MQVNKFVCGGAGLWCRSYRSVSVSNQSAIDEHFSSLAHLRQLRYPPRPNPIRHNNAAVVGVDEFSEMPFFLTPRIWPPFLPRDAGVLLGDHRRVPKTIY